MSRTSQAILVIAIIVLDFFMWREIFSARPMTLAREYFLNVGQGDSELILFPGGVTALIDAGPDATVVGELGAHMPANDTYIDLAVISYPAFADFNGFNFILDHYRVGAFMYNGRDADVNVPEWVALKNKIKEKGIPLVTLGARDTIHIGKSNMNILSPTPDFVASADLMETGFVISVTTSGFRTLFTADIPASVEDWLVARQPQNLSAGILKIANHASAYASGDAFLKAVNPEVAIIEFGSKNMFSKPSAKVLARLAQSTFARVLETDNQGTITISRDQGTFTITKDK
jgi:competence protein ComEC